MEVVGIDLALGAVFLVVPPQGPEKRKKCKWEKSRDLILKIVQYGIAG